MVTLALVGPGGEPLGELPPYQVDRPWWQEVWDVVARARDEFGIDVVVLRLLRAELPEPPGGAVTYLAEYDGPPPAGLRPGFSADWTAPDPRRLPWAKPGGPRASVAWVRGILGEGGTGGPGATRAPATSRRPGS